MRCSEFRMTQSTPVVYTCGKCATFFHEHGLLLEHLYWRHGTESQACTKCHLKKWTFAIHKCFILPQAGIMNDARNIEVNASPKLVKKEAYDNREAPSIKRTKPNTNSFLPEPKAVGFEVIPVNLGSISGRDDDLLDDDAKSSVSGDSQYFSERESKYCYCGKDIEGVSMIGCDNDNCILEWYHYQCVGIDEAPDGDWLCPECAKLLKF